MDSSIVDFDGLPDYLSHVKSSLESEIMPKRWRAQEGPSVALPVPLRDGFKGKQFLVCSSAARDCWSRNSHLKKIVDRVSLS